MFLMVSNDVVLLDVRISDSSMGSVHPVSRSGDGGVLSMLLLGCELVACWLLPALRDLMTCIADTYVALSPCCLIRIYCGGVGLVLVVRC